MHMYTCSVKLVDGSRGGKGGGGYLVGEAQVEQLTEGKVLAESATLPMLRIDRALPLIWLLIMIVKL